jgi:hypothetical protein
VEQAAAILGVGVKQNTRGAGSMRQPDDYVRRQRFRSMGVGVGHRHDASGALPGHHCDRTIDETGHPLRRLHSREAQLQENR